MIPGANVQQVSYETLQYGTDDFSDDKKIGTGGFGSVYLCKLHFGKVAVKRLHDSEAVIPGSFNIYSIFTFSSI